MYCIKRCLQAVTIVACSFGFHSSTIAMLSQENCQHNSLSAGDQLRKLRDQLTRLQQAADPLRLYRGTPLYNTICRYRDYCGALRDISTNSLYVLLQRVYIQAVDQLGVPTHLSELPVFCLIDNHAIQNILMYGDERCCMLPHQRDQAISRFFILVSMAASGYIDFERERNRCDTSEFWDAPACLSYIKGEQDSYWRDTLNDFRRKGQGKYIYETAWLFDHILSHLSHQEPIPFTFYDHALPNLLSYMGTHENQDVRRELIRHRATRHQVYKALCDEIEQERRTSSDTQEEASHMPQLEHEQEGYGESSVAHERMHNMRQLLSSLESEEEVDAAAMTQFQDRIQNMLRQAKDQNGGDAPTQWFTEAVFPRFLQRIDDPDMIQEFMRRPQSREKIQRIFRELWNISSEHELAQHQEKCVQFHSLKSDSMFQQTYDLHVEASSDDEDA